MSELQSEVLMLQENLDREHRKIGMLRGEKEKAERELQKFKDCGKVN